MSGRFEFEYRDTFDSRDVIDAINELARERTTLDDDERVEFRDLRAFARDSSRYCEDWQYGETFVNDAYFVEYAQELAEEIGAIPEDASWPASCIDWKQAADDLQADYTPSEYRGVTFWSR